MFEGAPDSPNLTVCDVEGSFLLKPGTGPFALNELQRLGCVDVPTQVDLPSDHWGILCSFDPPDLGLSSGSSALHVRGHFRNQSGNDDELWLEDLYVWVQ